MPLTKTQLEDVFWRATILCLGLDPDSKDQSVHNRVRISWPKGDGNSTWERDENVIFLRISPSDDGYVTPWDITHEKTNGQLEEVVRYHKCHSIQWICYGPNSGEDADCIRIGILRDSICTYLKEFGLAVLTGIRQPVRLPEMDDSGDWWERSDLTAQCYELAERRYAEGEIAVAPRLNFNLEGG